jgi:hypothetical protein
MARFEMLNNVDHGDVRIIQTRSASLGDDVWYVPTFPHEFRNLQRCYPVVFTKNTETGYFQAVALLGFEQGENLFLDGDRWDAGYIPLGIMRQPFLIGFQEQSAGGSDEPEPVISIDMESPRVSRIEGEPVFLEHGGNSEYLERVKSILHVIQQGFERNRAFADMLLGMDLLESFVLDVQLDDGSEHRMSGFYTINETTLKGLTGDDLVILNNNGFLEPVYMAIASMSHLPDLIDRKNCRMAARSENAAD